MMLYHDADVDTSMTNDISFCNESPNKLQLIFS